MGMIKLPASAVEKFKNNYGAIFESGNLAEGMWNKELARFYRSYTGALSSIPFSSNGSGLLAILILMRRYRHFENIFIQSNTMYGVKTIAKSSGLNYLGAVPCDLQHLMPTAAQVSDFLDKLADPKKTIFLLSHIGGIVNPDIQGIVDLCKSKGVVIVEDCAHSLGATLNGNHTGLYGVAGVYSLYATKAIAAGEGGIAVTNDADLADQLERFNIYDRFDQGLDVGVNFRVSEIQALLSLCVSELSEEIIANKSMIAARYINACQKAGISYIDPYKKGQRGNHYKFTLIAKNNNTDFSKITKRTSPIYDYKLGENPCDIGNRHICLPIWYGLEEEIIESVLSEIEACS